MPKLAKELTAIEVRNLSHPRNNSIPVFFPVGGVAGLMMQVTPNGAKSWALRYVSPIDTKRRKMGLGPFPEIGLAKARELAAAARAEIRGSTTTPPIDPVLEREAIREAAKATAQTDIKRRFTFADAVEAYLAAKVGEFSNRKHRQQWASTLQTYATPIIGDMPCADIAIDDVLRVLTPIWETKTETAKRLRGRIEKVLAWATVHGYRKGDNPARWGGNLDVALKKPSALKTVRHQPTMATADLPDWYADLLGREGSAARALQFAILTAARSGEVRAAEWGQIDLKARIWTRPASVMKMDVEHDVALSADAVALLEALPRFQGSDLVFPAPRGGNLSDMALNAVMRRIHASRDGQRYNDPKSDRPAVPHGLRAAFSTWANDYTEFAPELIEHALAHKVGSDVARAYNRGSALERRFALMDRWAAVLSGEIALGADGENVVAFNG